MSGSNDHTHTPCAARSKGTETSNKNLHPPEECGWTNSKHAEIHTILNSNAANSRKTQDCSQWSLHTSDVLKNRTTAAANIAARLSLMNFNHLTNFVRRGRDFLASRDWANVVARRQQVEYLVICGAKTNGVRHSRKVISHFLSV